MSWAPFLTRTLTIVPLLADAAKTVYETIDDIRANPGKARYEALVKCQKESADRHERAKKEMESMFEAFDEENKASERDADRRLREQREENEKVERQLMEMLAESQRKQDEAVRKMNEEHDRKMNGLREETKEEREKAEKEHKAKMEKLEKDQKEEKDKIEAKLEQTRKEGAAKVEKIEEETQKVYEERDEAQKVFKEQMEELQDIQHKLILAIQDENRQLRSENATERQLQLKKENDLTIAQIKERAAELRRHFSIEQSREMIDMFREVIEPFYEIRNSLDYIGSHCVTENGESPSIMPGELDLDIRAVSNEKGMYENRTRRFRQFLLNSPLAHADIRTACTRFIGRMDAVIANKAINNICRQLPNALTNDDLAQIKACGSSAQSLSNEIATIKVEMDAHLDRLAAAHLAIEGPGNTAINGEAPRPALQD